MEMKYYGIGSGGSQYYVKADGIIWAISIESGTPQHPCDCCTPWWMKETMKKDGTIFFEDQESGMGVMTSDFNHFNPLPKGAELEALISFCKKEEEKKEKEEKEEKEEEKRRFNKNVVKDLLKSFRYGDAKEHCRVFGLDYEAIEKEVLG